jgi:hypothetical protein
MWPSSPAFTRRQGELTVGQRWGACQALTELRPAAVQQGRHLTHAVLPLAAAAVVRLSYPELINQARAKGQHYEDPVRWLMYQVSVGVWRCLRGVGWGGGESGVEDCSSCHRVLCGRAGCRTAVAEGSCLCLPPMLPPCHPTRMLAGVPACQHLPARPGQRCLPVRHEAPDALQQVAGGQSEQRPPGGERLLAGRPGAQGCHSQGLL